MKFAFIHAEKAEKKPLGTVSELCRALEVSRTGYYAWVKRPQSKHQSKDALLAVKVVEIHQQNRGVYGRPRIHRDLKDQGFDVGPNRVARLMREQGLVGKAKKSFVPTTDSNHELEVAPNKLARDFKATAPHQKWVGDITYLATPEGWVYLAVIIDLFSRMVVGWAVGTVIDRHLVLKALEQAKRRRGKLAGGLFHSDRGAQYASEDHRKALTEAGLTCSMSRTGNCWDNAVSESFFATLKRELGSKFQNLAHAERELFDYIEVFFNQRRRHSTLDYKSPADFERNARAAA